MTGCVQKQKPPARTDAGDEDVIAQDAPYVDKAMSGNTDEPTPVIVLLLKLLAVVGALGTVGPRPVSVPPEDEVTEVHHPGVPVALFRK